jgi:acyl-CoA reductase-like NAD-dependent aldehyde dehydrogenase
VLQYTAKEITTAVMRGQYLNKVASQVLDHDVPGTEEKGFKRYIRREPVGVVLVIFAWNVRQTYLPPQRLLVLIPI